jgi:hypothetical protein
MVNFGGLTFLLDIMIEYAIFENYRYVPDQGEIWAFQNL